MVRDPFIAINRIVCIQQNPGHPSWMNTRRPTTGRKRQGSGRFNPVAKHNRHRAKTHPVKKGRGSYRREKRGARLRDLPTDAVDGKNE